MVGETLFQFEWQVDLILIHTVAMLQSTVQGQEMVYNGATWKKHSPSSPKGHTLRIK